MKKIIFLFLLLLVFTACSTEKTKTDITNTEDIINTAQANENELSEETIAKIESQNEEVFEEELKTEDIEKDLIELEQLDI